MTPRTPTIRQVEDLLRRVLRGDTGIDVEALRAAVRSDGLARGQRRRVHLALLAGGLVTLALVALFLVEWSRTLRP